MKYKNYSFSQHALMKEPYKAVNIKFKPRLLQLFCKHKYTYLTATKKNQIYYNISGDEIFCICPICGHVRYKTFWEHEGMGYK